MSNTIEFVVVCLNLKYKQKFQFKLLTLNSKGCLNLNNLYWLFEIEVVMEFEIQIDQFVILDFEVRFQLNFNLTNLCTTTTVQIGHHFSIVNVDNAQFLQ